MKSRFVDIVVAMVFGGVIALLTVALPEPCLEPVQPHHKQHAVSCQIPQDLQSVMVCATTIPASAVK